VPGMTHNRLVAAVEAEYGHLGPIGRRWFGRTLLRQVEDLELERVGIIPDAFIICPDEMLAVAFECEVATRLDELRLSRYARLWFHLDCAGWDLWLVEVDRHGRHRDIDLCDLWYERLERRAA
jgi:hypothetical protein